MGPVVLKLNENGRRYLWERMSTSSSDEEYDDALELCALLLYQRSRRSHMTRINTSEYTGLSWIDDILNGHQQRCQNNFRMKRLCFFSLCDRLQHHGLTATAEICVREMVGIFVYTMATGLSNRQLSERFQRSGSTISVCFHAVLDAFQLLAGSIIKPDDPEFNTVPHHISSSNRYYPYFQNCIGAIDGTHVMAHLPPHAVGPYIGRKGYATQNILAVCSFDLQFTFVLAGWEGTAHDSRILNSVITDRTTNFPTPPVGQYYLVDSGYSLQTGYLPPYRHIRYHIPHFRETVNQPKSANEVFNFYHSSLRMAIERTFGIWKKKFAILKSMPTYSLDTQIHVVAATMALHNFIRKYNSGDPDFMAFDDDPDLIPDEYMEEYCAMTNETNRGTERVQRNGRQEMSALRDSIRDQLVAAGLR